MLFRLTAKINGNAYIEQPYEIDAPPYRLLLRCDDEGPLNEISIEMRIADQDFPRFTADPEMYFLDIPAGPRLELIEFVQQFWALGGYFFDIHSIDWSNATQEWVPETEEEKDQVVAQKLDLEHSYPSIPRMVSKEAIIDLVDRLKVHQHLVIPMAFFREGMNAFNSLKFINAFYNFYFYLEDLYGGGKTKNYQVEKEFKKSQHLRQAISIMIDRLEKSEDQTHFAGIKKLLEVGNRPLTVDGIIELLVNTRGTLHHFSQKSTKRTGHPLNQQEFETIAYLIMGLCIKTFVQLWDTGEMPG